MDYSLHISNAVLRKALVCAESKGTNQSAVVESLLAQWTTEQTLEEKINNFPISDKVKSLAGRIKTSKAVDWEQQKDEYFKEKYGL